MDEVECERQRLLAERDAEGLDPGWRERFKPGTHGCHEALHMASVLTGQVDELLAQHPAVLLNADWHALASRAAELLADLYQAIGREHLAGDTSVRS